MLTTTQTVQGPFDSTMLSLSQQSDHSTKGRTGYGFPGGHDSPGHDSFTSISTTSTAWSSSIASSGSSSPQSLRRRRQRNGDSQQAQRRRRRRFVTSEDPMEDAVWNIQKMRLFYECSRNALFGDKQDVCQASQDVRKIRDAVHTMVDCHYFRPLCIPETRMEQMNRYSTTTTAAMDHFPRNGQ